MKIQLWFTAILILLGVGANASNINVTIDSIRNVANNTLIQVCGSAKSAAGEIPIFVTVQHENSFSTTVTDPNGMYCELIARENFQGSVQVTAFSLDKKSQGVASITLLK